MKLDPHKDVLAVEDVCPTMRAMIRDATAENIYVIRVGQVRPCGTCGKEKELRFGHCHACAKAADPGTTP